MEINIIDDKLSSMKYNIADKKAHLSNLVVKKESLWLVITNKMYKSRNERNDEIDCFSARFL